MRISDLSSDVCSSDLGRRILPKAEREEEARACLDLLSGRRHRVHGGICLVAPGGRTIVRTVQTVVAFKRLTKAEVDAYIAAGEWRGTAGGYATQRGEAAMVRGRSGFYPHTVGLRPDDVPSGDDGGSQGR